MKEKILLSTIQKMSSDLSVEFLTPTSENVSVISKEQLLEHYTKLWHVMLDCHDLCFKCGQTIQLLDTIEL